MFTFLGCLMPVMGFWVKSMLMFWALMEVQLFLIVGALANINFRLTQVYFCINSLGGILILMGSGVYTSCGDAVGTFFSGSFQNHLGVFFVFLGLCIKIGMVPFPFWVPYLSGLAWGLGSRLFFFSGVWLLVISKLLPLMGIFHFSSLGYSVFSLLLLNLYVSGIGMFLSGNFGELLGWSSTGGTSIWVVLGWASDFLALLCFMVYSVVLLWALWEFHNISGLVLLFFLLGVPPLSFFAFKVFAMLELINVPFGGFFDLLDGGYLGGLGAVLMLVGFLGQMVSYLYYVSLFGF